MSVSYASQETRSNWFLLFVGTAQSASRTLLARIIPAGREGEVFGLYATTGRAAIWMSPALYAAAIALSPATTTTGRPAYGILGILVVILIVPDRAAAD